MNEPLWPFVLESRTTSQKGCTIFLDLSVLGQHGCEQPVGMLLPSAAAHPPLWMKAKAALRHSSHIWLTHGLQMLSPARPIHFVFHAAQDFRTGYLTLTSAKAMFISQLAGATMGCILAPATFFMIYYAFPDLGQPGKRGQISACIRLLSFAACALTMVYGLTMVL